MLEVEVLRGVDRGAEVAESTECPLVVVVMAVAAALHVACPVGPRRRPGRAATGAVYSDRDRA